MSEILCVSALKFVMTFYFVAYLCKQILQFFCKVVSLVSFIYIDVSCINIKMQ